MGAKERRCAGGQREVARSLSDRVDPAGLDEVFDGFRLEPDVAADLAERDPAFSDEPANEARTNAEQLGDLIDAEQSVSHALPRDISLDSVRQAGLVVRR